MQELDLDYLIFMTIELRENTIKHNSKVCPSSVTVALIINW